MMKIGNAYSLQLSSQYVGQETHEKVPKLFRAVTTGACCGGTRQCYDGFIPQEIKVKLLVCLIEL